MDSYLGYDISRDSGYNARSIPPAMSVGYDWCYDQLTQEQKNIYVNQLNSWRDVYLKPGAYASNNPGDNYFYGYLVAEGLSGLATYGDNPRAREFIDDARKCRFELAKNFFDTNLVGGHWNEGWAYGAGSMMYLSKYMLAVRTATDENIFESSPFFRDVIKTMLHLTLPSMSHLYPEGDWSRESTGRICDYHHSFMDIFSPQFISEDIGQYGVFWIRNTSEEKFSFLAWERFLWEDPAYPEKDYRLHEPLQCYFPGIGLLVARSGWDKDATWVSFKCGDRLAGHGDFNQNTFTIFKYEWVAPDANIYSRSGIRSETTIHNGILIDDKGQTSLNYGKSKIERYELQEEYIYAQGEASGAYNSYYNGNILERFTRSFIYLRPDKVVIFDRVITINPASTKKWILHSKNEPFIESDIVSSINGNSKIFLKMLYPEPETSMISKVQLTSDMNVPNWYIEIQPSQLQKQNNFLNVLYVTDASVPNMPQTIKVTGTTLIGCQTEDWIVMFSQEETQLESGQFNVAGTGTYRTIITNLIPKATYSLYLDNNYLGSYVAKDSGLIDFSLLLNGNHSVSISYGQMDTIKPGSINDVSAITGEQSGTVILTWTATGDDGDTGKASSYIIRYFTTAIDSNNWDSAFDVDGEPSPQSAGNRETFTITGLSPGQTYYFAVRALDEAGNISDVSNSPSTMAGREPLGEPSKPIHVDTLGYNQ